MPMITQATSDTDNKFEIHFFQFILARCGFVKECDKRKIAAKTTKA
tara:strand:+ start:1923 stop:2060 length:138 start_codon:yes stop_codon:yes gene_type:complete